MEPVQEGLRGLFENNLSTVVDGGWEADKRKRVCATLGGVRVGTKWAAPILERAFDTFRSADQYYAIKGITATPELMRLSPAPTWFLNLEGFD